jgi:hypothetical protein
MSDDLKRASREVGSSDRVFGLVFAAFFFLVAVGPLFVGRPIHLWSLAVSVAFGVVALVAPAALAPLNRVWTKFGLLLHKVVSPVILGIMFYVVITPMGLVMRLLGKDPLRLRWEPKAATYWIERSPPGPPPETFIDQF